MKDAYYTMFGPPEHVLQAWFLIYDGFEHELR